ncbi:FAD-binding protein [Paenibacillus agaridevorans]|uniref:FAD-binding protein n=1 Tax=Paenibacillus agaridevorans TaxID=171404 RepID=UPI001BE4453A|nr:FAD-binding protein [Paenibacillus agaridevorans]
MKPLYVQTDVLVIGSGAAGMVAAKAAADKGSRVVLADKSIIGRGGATVLAQMTVAVALGEAEEDHPDIHFEDTIKGSRGMADPDIVRTIVDRGPELINELEGYGVKWARTAEGIRSQVVAPGHSRRRCVYVDILNTGGATSAGLRRAIWKDKAIERIKNIMITKIVVEDGRAVGAIGFSIEQLQPVKIDAKAIILATGGLTEIYERNSASANMTGDGFVLAAEAGAELRDMEMVQFFPIAHLHPPLVGIDPIMWDPFRYKLGGRLLNGLQEEFMDRYNNETSGVYTAARDQTSFAIFSEVKEGRGTPHGGAYLDFRMVPEPKLKEAFGSTIDLLSRQGIDLTKDLVEVAPMAHFTMGGIKINTQMETTIEGLYACGELINGMHGANRLSGNALTEAFVSGRIAGEQAARLQTSVTWSDERVEEEFARLEDLWHPRQVAQDEGSMLAIKHELQKVMWEGAGPLRTEEKLVAAGQQLAALRDRVIRTALAKSSAYVLNLVEKVELLHMIMLGEAIVEGALLRKETRGAHVRLDYEQSYKQPVSIQYKWHRDGAWELQSHRLSSV